MRAIQVRTVRYDSRTLRAEPLRDEHDERQHREGDERQPPVHRDSSTTMMPTSVKTSPKIETTPDVNRSFRTSTSS